MNSITFDKKCKCGKEFVCVRILQNCEDLKVGNIWLPSNAEANNRLAHCIIEDVGQKAAEEYGLVVGDYVLIDRLSTFAHTKPVALLKFNNVILKTNKDMTDFWPLKNMVFVEPDKNDGVTMVGNIAVSNYADKLHTGKILKINCEKDQEFSDGDTVLLVKGGDVVKLGTTTLHIYKYDMIVCSFED